MKIPLGERKFPAALNVRGGIYAQQLIAQGKTEKEVVFAREPVLGYM
jgi:hypothetical protein